MKTIFAFLLGLLALSSREIAAQDIQSVRRDLAILCSDSLAGRGYVDDGVNKAAAYLQYRLKNLNLKPIGKDYFQSYGFPVNTHPYPIRCTLDQQALRVGYDFLVDAGSPGVRGTYRLLHFNPTDSLDRILLFKKLAGGIQSDQALVLHRPGKWAQLVRDTLSKMQVKLPLLIRTEEKKLTHTMATELDELPQLIIFDSLIQNKEKIAIEAPNEFVKRFTCHNIGAFIKGKVKDSFLVFTAHYDHLGKQGDALFPGASDNASGVSMLLYLAEWFTKHKPRYNVVFIFFSGEEAGLIGSSIYVRSPEFPLEKIAQLVNIDIMGNAEQGITMVNGESQRACYDAMVQINNNLKLIPDVGIRSQAANSDHYPFSESGVPAVFIYSKGGQGYYHDVLDTHQNVMLTNFEAVAKLLTTWAEERMRKK